VVLYNMSVAGVRVVEFGPYRRSFETNRSWRSIQAACIVTLDANHSRKSLKVKW